LLSELPKAIPCVEVQYLPPMPVKGLPAGSIGDCVSSMRLCSSWIDGSRHPYRPPTFKVAQWATAVNELASVGAETKGRNAVLAPAPTPGRFHDRVPPAS